MDNHSVNTSNSRQAVWVGISSFSKFLIGILSSVILARYFSKTEYGTYKQIVYVYNTFLTLFAAGLPNAYAYFLPKLSSGEGKGVINKLSRMFVILGVIYSLSLFLMSGLIADALKNPELERGLKLFAAVPLMMMPTLGIEGVYTAIRRTHVLAIYTTITRLGMLAFITLPVIILKGTYETAIIGWLFSSFLTLVLAVYLKYRPFKKVKTIAASISNNEILKYSLPLMVASLAGVFILFADQFFLSRYFGTEVFADYSNGFIPLPFITMITGATAAVFVPLFSGLIEKENGKASIALHWKNGVNKMIILTFPILVFFMFYAKEVIHILFGPLYDKSYIYFRLAMILNFSLPFLFNPILFATGKTKLYANIHIVHAIIVWLLGVAVCEIGASPYYYMILSVALGILSKFVGLAFAAKHIDTSLVKLLSQLSVVKLLLPCIAIGFAAKELLRLITQDVTATFILGGMVYLGLLWGIDRLFRLRILKTALSAIRKE